MFQMARIAAVLFNFFDLCYQWLDCAHVVLFGRRISVDNSFSRGEQGRRGGDEQVTPPLACSARRRRLKTHSPRYRSDFGPSKTALKLAIENGEAYHRTSAVAEYLRSIGAP